MPGPILGVPFPGKDGADGKDGLDGKPGPPGPPGPAAQITDADIDLIIARIPPIYPQWLHPTDVDANGDPVVIDEIKQGVRPGETLPLRITAEVINAGTKR